MKIPLSEEEKKICAQEMAIRYAYNNGKQPTPEQRASSKGARARTPSAPREKKMTADGKEEICIRWLENRCPNKAVDCKYAHRQ